MLKQLVLTVRLPLSPGRKKIILMETKFAKITVQNIGSIVSNYVIFSINLKKKKSQNLQRSIYQWEATLETLERTAIK